MRLADARLNASSISSSSIRLSLVGVQIDWITKTSPPRTFSVISTWTSPSLKRPISAPPERHADVCADRLGQAARLEFPANSLISSFTERATPPCVSSWAGRSRTFAAGSKVRCLTSLATAQGLVFSSRPDPAKTTQLVFACWEVNTMRHKLLPRKAHADSRSRAAVRAGGTSRDRPRGRAHPSTSRRPSCSVAYKSAVDVVTATDRQAELIILEALRGLVPRPRHRRRRNRRHGPPGAPTCGTWTRWTAPPTSSTAYPHCAVSIALEHRGELVLGLVHDPLRRETFSASAEAGRSLNGAPDRGLRRRQSDPTRSRAPAFPTIAATTPASYVPVIQAGIERTRSLRWSGSAALDLSYVACGRLDAYWEWHLRALGRRRRSADRRGSGRTGDGFRRRRPRAHGRGDRGIQRPPARGAGRDAHGRPGSRASGFRIELTSSERRAGGRDPDPCASQRRPVATSVRPRGEMDITQASGAWGRGSIPLGGTRRRFRHRLLSRHPFD